MSFQIQLANKNYRVWQFVLAGLSYKLTCIHFKCRYTAWTAWILIHFVGTISIETFQISICWFKFQPSTRQIIITWAKNLSPDRRPEIHINGSKHHLQWLDNFLIFTIWNRIYAKRRRKVSKMVFAGFLGSLWQDLAPMVVLVLQVYLGICKVCRFKPVWKESFLVSFPESADWSRNNYLLCQPKALLVSFLRARLENEFSNRTEIWGKENNFFRRKNPRVRRGSLPWHFKTLSLPSRLPSLDCTSSQAFMK